MTYIKKRDLILALILLLAAAAFFGYKKLFSAPGGARAQISVEGRIIQTVELNKDQTLTINGKDGGVNKLLIKDGEISCTDASCPDRLCVKQGKKHLADDTIVCLPNKMIVTIIGGD